MLLELVWCFLSFCLEGFIKWYCSMRLIFFRLNSPYKYVLLTSDDNPLLGDNPTEKAFWIISYIFGMIWYFLNVSFSILIVLFWMVSSFFLQPTLCARVGGIDNPVDSNW